MVKIVYFQNGFLGPLLFLCKLDAMVLHSFKTPYPDLASPLQLFCHLL